MYEFWVTELEWGKRDANRQMKFLNQVSDEKTWEFVTCNTQGQFIFRRPR